MCWFHQHRYLLGVLALSFLPFIFWLSPDLVHTHDGLVHLPRLATYYNALNELNFPVRWAGNINYGYGIPLFVFIYSTPYLVGSVFLKLGLGLVTAFKLSLLVGFLLSGVFMFLFAKRFFKDEKIAFLVVLLYQFAPFHLIDQLIRGSFGEVYAYAFLPLVLYFIVCFFDTKKVSYLLFSSLATFFLIISHNSISLLFFAVSVVFCLFFGKTLRLKIFSLLSLLGGMVLSAYYWVPAIIEHKYTLGNLYMKDLYKDHFFSIWKTVVPNLIDAPFLQKDNLSLQIGLMQILVIALGIVWFLRSKKKDKLLFRLFVFSSILVLVSMLFMSGSSDIFWRSISQLRQFQFPWRFLAVIVFAASMYGVFAFSYLKKNIYYFGFCFLIVLTSVIYWFPKEGYDKVDEDYYWNFPLTSTYYGETDVIWTAGEAKQYPDSLIDVVSGEAKVKNVVKKNNSQSFEVSAVSPTTLVSNTVYFPGWSVYLVSDDKKTKLPIQFQDPNHRGWIQFSVPKGSHRVNIIFEESKIRYVTNKISILGFLSIVILFVFLRNRKV